MTSPTRPSPHMSFTDILKLTPEEIQAWLDAKLAAAPPDVQKVITKVDYVEPGSVRSPECEYYLKIGAYEGDEDTIEVAYQVAPGAQALFALVLRLF